ncbi:MAG: hypothetical protein IMZ58_04740 [Thermoplasmata archaeon]|nr:hypothetical protein [Thermoplasmata archaeon]
MKKGIFCVFVCMLMIVSTIVPVSGTVFVKRASQPTVKENIQYIEVEKIFNDLKLKLDTVTTKKEALAIFKEAVVELNKYGLLPKGMSVKQAQRLITGSFLKSELLKPFQRNNENNSGNENCLVIGITNNIYFRPYPALVMDIPILYNLVFNSSLRNITWILALPYLFRLLQPFKFGSYAYVGGRTKLVEQGNITEDNIYSSSGWVWTIGSNGFKKWNGAFYGGLYCKTTVISHDNDSVFEFWDPVGIVGFIGIDFFSGTSFIINPYNGIPQFYIGFAREVNFTYSCPWS